MCSDSAFRRLKVTLLVLFAVIYVTGTSIIAYKEISKGFSVSAAAIVVVFALVNAWIVLVVVAIVSTMLHRDTNVAGNAGGTEFV
jgi:hypothetical protein